MKDVIENPEDAEVVSAEIVDKPDPICTRARKILKFDRQISDWRR